MEKNRGKSFFNFIILACVTAFALAPIFIMLYASFKPLGNKGYSPKEIKLLNPLNATTLMQNKKITPYPDPSTSAQVFIKNSQYIGDFLSVSFLKKPDKNQCGLAIEIQQDMRKFSHIALLIKREKETDIFRIGISDAYGNKKFVCLNDYIVNKDSNWERIKIPVKAFFSNTSNVFYRKKIVEKIIIEPDVIESNSLEISNISLMEKFFTLANYQDILLCDKYFYRYFINSLIIVLIITIANIILSAMAGYVFAKKDFAFKSILFLLTIVLIIIPQQIFMIPMFILIKKLGWLNTYIALILPFLILPFNIFLTRQFISKIPNSLIEAARADGASEFYIFFKIIMPLSKPALVMVGINTFISNWNSFLFPFIFTNTNNMYTLPVGLVSYKSLHGAEWNLVMAGAAITAIPVFFMFLIFQKYLITVVTKETASSWLTLSKTKHIIEKIFKKEK